MRTKAAAKHFGSKTALAKALGITKSAVSFWGEIVPEGRAYQIESLTRRALRVDPQLYRKTAAPTRPGISAHAD